MSDIKVIKSPFPVWKTVELGLRVAHLREIQTIAKQINHRTSWHAENIFNLSRFSKKTRIANLVRVSVADLGFPNGATRKAIYDKAISFGLELCPNETVLKLAIEHTNSPSGETLHMGMEPVVGKSKVPRIFRLVHDIMGRWMGGAYGHEGIVWPPDTVWIFIAP